MTFYKYSEFIKPKRRISRVYLHCSASDHKHHDNPETVDQWHKDRNWSGIGYHYFISFDGTIWEGRPLSRRPAAQGGKNRGTIAICVHGGQNGKPNAFRSAQYAAVYDLCKTIDAAYAGKVTFHGHCEVSPKSCPVFDYKSELGLDKLGHIRAGVPTRKKLAVAGSKTVDSVRRSDEGAGILGLTAIGGVIADTFAPAADLGPTAIEKVKQATETATQWRKVMEKVGEFAMWGLDHWWAPVGALVIYILWNNRRIIAARIADEPFIQRLTWDSSHDD